MTKKAFTNTLTTKGGPRRTSILYQMQQQTLPGIRKRLKVHYPFFASNFNNQTSYAQPPELEDRDGEKNKPPQFKRK